MSPNAVCLFLYFVWYISFIISYIFSLWFYYIYFFSSFHSLVMFVLHSCISVIICLCTFLLFLGVLIFFSSFQCTQFSRHMACAMVSVAFSLLHIYNYKYWLYLYFFLCFFIVLWFYLYFFKGTIFFSGVHEWSLHSHVGEHDALCALQEAFSWIIIQPHKHNNLIFRLGSMLCVITSSRFLLHWKCSGVFSIVLRNLLIFFPLFVIPYSLRSLLLWNVPCILWVFYCITYRIIGCFFANSVLNGYVNLNNVIITVFHL